MKRSDIIDAFVSRLETIRTTAGFNTNAGTNVERDRVETISDDEDYLIDVVAGSWESTDESVRVRRWMNVTVAFAAKGDDAVSVIENITEDVISAIYSDVTFSGTVISTEETGGAADKDVAENLYAWGEVDFRVLYDTVSGEI